LKKQKVLLANRLHQLNWSSVPPQLEAFDLKMLRNLVTELENHCRLRIKGHMDEIDSEVVALRDQQQYWRECLNVTFEPYYAAIPV
jgi:hypothetical protein